MNKCDFLVIGSGIAGLIFALKVAKYGHVVVVSKKSLFETNTSRAQGGIAAVSHSNDSFNSHIEDTIKAGCGLSDPEIVKKVVHFGPTAIEILKSYGVEFDRQDDFNYDLHLEGGHRHRRIYHRKDSTGLEIQTKLLNAAKASHNIEFLEGYTAIDLITTHKLSTPSHPQNKVLGVYLLEPAGQDVITCSAKVVLVATGGAGKVYLYTTNSDTACGDGMAMCFRAGLPLVNMEFYQFHPTCLYHPTAKSFLISEAVRGEGGILITSSGERFMPKYSPLAELAPRDIVARSIDYEMKRRGEDCVFLDITHLPKDDIIEKFPKIYSKCLSYGIDITSEPIPVVPAAHYCCGGVPCNEFGETAIDSLFVAGECAHTGLHGANRLASNSLLEGVCFAAAAAEKAIQKLPDLSSTTDLPPWEPGRAIPSDERIVVSQLWDEIRRFMWNFVGIARSDKRLERALRRCEMLRKEIREYYWNVIVDSDLIELRNIAIVAEAIVRSAILRKESRGLHYNIDYPRTSEEYAQNTVIRNFESL